MPWRTRTVEDERARFVIEAEISDLSHAELWRRHGISRPTGYKWIQRFKEEGIEGLRDRSHRPGLSDFLCKWPVSHAGSRPGKTIAR